MAAVLESQAEVLGGLSRTGKEPDELYQAADKSFMSPLGLHLSQQLMTPVRLSATYTHVHQANLL